MINNKCTRSNLKYYHLNSDPSRSDIMDTYLKAWKATLFDKSFLDAPFSQLPNWESARLCVDKTLPVWLPAPTEQEYHDVLERIKSLVKNWLSQYEGHASYYGYVHAFWLRDR